MSYPGSDKGVKDLKQQPFLGKRAIGDQLESPGERAVAKDTRLLYEGAHESHMTAVKMEERLETGSALMEQTLHLMTLAASHKAKFKDAVYEIRDLLKTNPDFGRELREVLGPVRAIIRTKESDVLEDDKYEDNIRRLDVRVGGIGSGKAREIGSKVKSEGVVADEDRHKRPCR
jgi:hypothetical protein